MTKKKNLTCHIQWANFNSHKTFIPQCQRTYINSRYLLLHTPGFKMRSLHLQISSSSKAISLPAILLLGLPVSQSLFEYHFTVSAIIGSFRVWCQSMRRYPSQPCAGSAKGHRRTCDAFVRDFGGIGRGLFGCCSGVCSGFPESGPAQTTGRPEEDPNKTLF